MLIFHGLMLSCSFRRPLEIHTFWTAYPSKSSPTIEWRRQLAEQARLEIVPFLIPTAVHVQKIGSRSDTLLHRASVQNLRAVKATKPERAMLQDILKQKRFKMIQTSLALFEPLTRGGRCLFGTYKGNTNIRLQTTLSLSLSRGVAVYP